MEQLLKDTSNLLQSSDWVKYRQLAHTSGGYYIISRLEQYLTDDSVRNKVSRTQQDWMNLEQFISLGYLTKTAEIHEVSKTYTVSVTPSGQWLLDTLDVFKRYSDIFNKNQET